MSEQCVLLHRKQREIQDLCYTEGKACPLQGPRITETRGSDTVAYGWNREHGAFILLSDGRESAAEPIAGLCIIDQMGNPGHPVQ